MNKPPGRLNGIKDKEFKMKYLKATVHWNGKIEFIDFTSKTPEECLDMGLKVGPKMKGQIEVQARLSRTSKDIYVPGMPEALDNDMALLELYYFVEVIRWRMAPKKTRGKWPVRKFESCVTDPTLALKKKHSRKRK